MKRRNKCKILQKSIRNRCHHRDSKQKINLPFKPSKPLDAIGFELNTLRPGKISTVQQSN